MNALIFSIGQKIRDLRSEKGMTLGDLAEKIKVSPSLISQLERGIKSPSLKTIRQVASALGVKASALLRSAERLSN